jgi:signal transduction histidine kinase
MSTLPTLLLIDPDAREREHYRCLLQDEYRLIDAPNGEEAIRRCREETPECVLLDPDLPDTDGIALLSRLLSASSTHRFAIVVFTHAPDTALAVQMLKSGAYDYLLKRSLNPSRLRHSLRNARNDVSLKRQLQEHRLTLMVKNREIERALVALGDADQRKDEFLANLAHELRNPLAPMRNALQILQGRADADPLQHWCQDIIERQIAQMARLLDDLLDISRITQNRLELRRESVELGDILENAIEVSRPLIDASTHRFEAHLPATSVYLDADASRLTQVFSNLLNNAAKYTDPGGHIELTVEVAERSVTVSILDNGIGIAPDVAPTLFDRFSQARPALARAQGGLGIGLSLVRGLVELHGGRVDARSDGIGHGSEFFVYLPTTTAPAEAPPPSIVIPHPQAVPSRQRILVIDDNRDSADSLSVMLELLGHDVRAAYGGAEGMALASELKPDVVLLDLGMPRVNGYDVARYVREQDWGQHTILVALTGWSQEKNRLDSAHAGFDHHLAKPVEARAFHDILKSKTLRSPTLS